MFVYQDFMILVDQFVKIVHRLLRDVRLVLVLRIAILALVDVRRLVLILSTVIVLRSYNKITHIIVLQIITLIIR